jgi:hypothetical protein
MQIPSISAPNERCRGSRRFPTRVRRFGTASVRHDSRVRPTAGLRMRHNALRRRRHDSDVAVSTISGTPKNDNTLFFHEVVMLAQSLLMVLSLRWNVAFGP